jgi:hypothetical protein
MPLTTRAPSTPVAAANAGFDDMARIERPTPVLKSRTASSATHPNPHAIEVIWSTEMMVEPRVIGLDSPDEYRNGREPAIPSTTAMRIIEMASEPIIAIELPERRSRLKTSTLSRTATTPVAIHAPMSASEKGRPVRFNANVPNAPSIAYWTCAMFGNLTSEYTTLRPTATSMMSEVRIRTSTMN